jgi:hypothetical protein
VGKGLLSSTSLQLGELLGYQLTLPCSLFSYLFTSQRLRGWTQPTKPAKL